ncbi:MAG: hypothetical protein WC554_08385 [Clostridia bacterium]
MTYIPRGTNGIYLRLKSIGFDSYQEYLLSKHWIEFKKRVFRDRKDMKKMLKKYGGYRCQFCFRDTKLSVHHWTYKRLGNEYMGDVYVICDDCHNEIHRYNKNGLHNLHKSTHIVKRYKSIHMLVQE